MSRLITELGALTPTPDPRNELVFNFDASIPSTLDLFALEMYPWGYAATGQNNLKPGSVKTQLKNINGAWVDVWQEPLGEGQQITINEELQYFVRDHEVEGYNLPAMKEIVDGVLNMYCRQTPDNFKDIALTAVDKYGDYIITAVDEVSRTVTIQGRRYDRTKPSSDNLHETGIYTGFNRFLRDELTGDPAIDLHWKRRQYDYGWIILQPSFGNGELDRKVKYTSVTDSHEIDPKYGNGEATTHVITIAEDQLSAQEWANIVGGGHVKLLRRLPWIAPMLATGGNFSQKYFIANFILSIDNHAEQFFALWFWGNYLKFFDEDFPEFFDVNGDPLYDFDYKHEGGTELDGLEWPGGGDWYTKYHNLHSGSFNMHSYAQDNDIDPVMDIDNEWNKINSCEHLVAIAKGAADFIKYDEFFELQVSWLPPGHARNPRDVGVVIWDIAQEGQPLKFLCGCITPPFWDENPGIPKQLFVNNAVGGSFVNNVKHIYARGLTSTKNTDTIVNKLKSVKIYQVPGQVKGGSGYIDSNSTMSRGYGPTDGDITGNSGTGIVAVDSTTFPPPPPPDDDGGVIIDEDNLLPVNKNISRIRLLVKPPNSSSNTVEGGDITNNYTTFVTNNVYLVDSSDVTVAKKEDPSDAEILVAVTTLGAEPGESIVYTTDSGAKITWEVAKDINDNITVNKITTRPVYSTLPSLTEFRGTAFIEYRSADSVQWLTVTTDGSTFWFTEQNTTYSQSSSSTSFIEINAQNFDLDTQDFEDSFPDPSLVAMWTHAYVSNVGEIENSYAFYRGKKDGADAWLRLDYRG